MNPYFGRGGRFDTAVLGIYLEFISKQSIVWVALPLPTPRRLSLGETFYVVADGVGRGKVETDRRGDKTGSIIGLFYNVSYLESAFCWNPKIKLITIITLPSQGLKRNPSFSFEDVDFYQTICNIFFAMKSVSNRGNKRAKV